MIPLHPDLQKQEFVSARNIRNSGVLYFFCFRGSLFLFPQKRGFAFASGSQGESFPLQEIEDGILKVFMAFGNDRGCWGQGSRGLYVMFMKKVFLFSTADIDSFRRFFYNERGRKKSGL